MKPGDLIAAALSAGSDQQLAHVLRRLSQVCDGRDAFAHTARAALDRCLPELVQRAASSADSRADLSEALGFAVLSLQPGTGAIAAMDNLPAATGPLAGLVTQVLLIGAMALETAAADGADELLSERAHAHAGLARAFDAQGEREWAVAAGQRAVEIHRKLVEHHGQARVGELATALNNLAVDLHEASQAEESLRASEEAVGLFRRLAEMEGDAYLPSLANALANLSVSLAEAGRDDEALAAAEEAADLLRAPADAGTGSQADLAWVRHNLSVRLAASGRDAEALAAIKEAVRIRRRLSRSGRDRDLGRLASSLNSYSLRLNAIGRHVDALAATEEAVRIRRELAAARRGARPRTVPACPGRSAEQPIGRPEPNRAASYGRSSGDGRGC
jgi:tetratricopeptide (TPR) repeat protein